MITKGQVLNDTYEIIERLGSGGGGIIYKAYHRRMQKYVAIKLIKDEIKGDLNSRSEVDMLKNLKNDFLPQVIDFVEDGNDVYTVMEFIEGQNFKQLIYSGRKFDEKHVRKYAVQLCRAVKYLHSQNPPIIHSDIKPANVMLTPQDNICLIDFNISMLSNNGIATAIGGSQGFAAPEQFKRIINVPTYIDDFHEETRFIDNDETEILLDSEISAKQTSKMKTKNTAVAFIDTRTDIYGIGATIYYMLTSRTPISGYVDFRGIRCSSAIKDIILKAMNPNPSKRFQSVSEMYKALLNNSYKKSKVPKYIALAFLAAGLCFAAIFGLDQLKSNMEDHAVQTYNTDITTTVFIDETEESVTTADENDDNDVIQYYDDGVVKCLKTAQNDDGSYELTWYDWDGAKDIVETYSTNDKLSYVKVYNSHNGELSWEGVPELTDDGYCFKRTVGENNNYSFSKSYIDKNKENHKVVYFDENENILYWRTYDYEYFDDGSRSTTWYDENKNKLYTVFYSNGKRTQRVYYNEDGTIKNIINYDNDEKPITETTTQTTVTTTTIPATTPTTITQMTTSATTTTSVSFDTLEYKKEWNETETSETFYIKTSCYSRTRAVVGSESVKKYEVGTKIDVVAATDTGYWKLKDGTFIHGDYLTDEKPWSEAPKNTAAPKLNKTSETITKGYQTTFWVSNASGTVTWSTGDKSIATVSSKGKVIGKNPGTTYIYAKTGSTTLKCKVTVVASKITANKSSVTLDKVGATATVTFTVKGSHSGITVGSTDSSVATASFSTTKWDGDKVTVKITATGAGNARIKVYNENYQSTCYKYVDVSVEDTTD